MSTRPFRALLPLLLVLLSLATSAQAQQPAHHVEEQIVYEIAAKLRCVVCQNLSVADSPSEMASQMRAVIRERLAAGDRPEQVIEYFIDKYGEWILLEPRRQGFTLLVWVLPPIGALAGLAVAGVLAARWARRKRREPPPPPVDPAMSERIRREMETEG